MRGALRHSFLIGASDVYSIDAERVGLDLSTLLRVTALRITEPAHVGDGPRPPMPIVWFACGEERHTLTCGEWTDLDWTIHSAGRLYVGTSAPCVVTATLQAEKGATK